MKNRSEEDRIILKSFNNKYDEIREDVEKILRYYDSLDYEESSTMVTKYIMFMLLGCQEQWKEDNL